MKSLTEMFNEVSGLVIIDDARKERLAKFEKWENWNSQYDIEQCLTIVEKENDELRKKYEAIGCEVGRLKIALEVREKMYSLAIKLGEKFIKERNELHIILDRAVFLLENSWTFAIRNIVERFQDKEWFDKLNSEIPLFISENKSIHGVDKVELGKIERFTDENNENL